MKKATILFMVFLVIFCFAFLRQLRNRKHSGITNGANEFEQL